MQRDLGPSVQAAAERWKTRDLDSLRRETGKDRCIYVFDLTISILSRQGPVKENDIADLFHFVVPMARADFVVLDRKWNDFARQLRLPDGFGQAYRVTDIESFFNDLVIWPER